MELNNKQRNVKIIAEIHPQHMGSISEVERMIIQCKISGADYVKVQLYSSKKLFNNTDREFLEFKKDEFLRVNEYANKIGIDLFASVFDEERVKWCEEANVKLYKIASRTVDNKKLCDKILSTNKPVIISLGMYDYKNKKLPFDGKNIIYLYCVSKYPTSLTDLDMPNFDKSFFRGFSDHTLGLSASIFAVSRGAEFIEKHFSNNSSMNVDTQMAHICSMNSADLLELRKYSDSLTLIRSKLSKWKIVLFVNIGNSQLFGTTK